MKLTVVAPLMLTRTTPAALVHAPVIVGVVEADSEPSVGWSIVTTGMLVSTAKLPRCSRR